MFENLKADGNTILPGPNIMSDDFLHSLRTLDPGDEPVIKFASTILKTLRRSNTHPVKSEEDMDILKECLITTAEKFDDVIPCMIQGGIIRLLTRTHRAYISNQMSECLLDELIHDILAIVLDVRKTRNYFKIRFRGATRQAFKVCGVDMISHTNVSVNYLGALNEELDIPVVLSENVTKIQHSKSVSTKQRSTASTGTHASLLKDYPWLKVAPQITGQCLSVAHKSPFETDDFKIVYHVSLYDKHYITITRTHIAKTTLQAMVGECHMTEAESLSPSYMCVMSIDILEAPIHFFQILYMTFTYLMKYAEVHILNN
ncbi:uncharacterized protein [Ptychodera flava]|uniref:uncharacterized protein n=1 Tax=Ptychodera flava TaxID=63121 RepID=UPI00396A2821